MINNEQCVCVYVSDLSNSVVSECLKGIRILCKTTFEMPKFVWDTSSIGRNIYPCNSILCVLFSLSQHRPVANFCDEGIGSPIPPHRHSRALKPPHQPLTLAYITGGQGRSAYKLQALQAFMVASPTKWSIESPPASIQQ